MGSFRSFPRSTAGNSEHGSVVKLPASLTSVRSSLGTPRPDRRTFIRVSRLRNSDRLHANWYRRSRSPSVLTSNDRIADCWAAWASARWRCPAASASSRPIARSAIPRSVAVVADSFFASRSSNCRSNIRSKWASSFGWGSSCRHWRCRSYSSGPMFSGCLPSRRIALTFSAVFQVPTCSSGRGARSSGPAATGSRRRWIRGGR